MTGNNKQQLEQQLWNIANTLRGKMGADDFRDYILDPYILGECLSPIRISTIMG